MTRKDFQLIADVLNAQYRRLQSTPMDAYDTPLINEAVQAERTSLLYTLILDTAVALEATNARFNRDKFVSACTNAK